MLKIGQVEYLTVLEAAECLGVARASLNRILPTADHKEKLPTGQIPGKRSLCNLYRRERVEETRRRRERARTTRQNGRGNRGLASRRSRPAPEDDDPWGVMVKPRLGTRHCPRCGAGPLYIGQYLCENCRAAAESELNEARHDGNYVYGGCGGVGDLGAGMER